MSLRQVQTTSRGLVAPDPMDSATGLPAGVEDEQTRPCVQPNKAGLFRWQRQRALPFPRKKTKRTK